MPIAFLVGRVGKRALTRVSATAPARASIAARSGQWDRGASTDHAMSCLHIDVEALAVIAHACPSGAIRFRRKDGRRMRPRGRSWCLEGAFTNALFGIGGLGG